MLFCGSFALKCWFKLQIEGDPLAANQTTAVENEPVARCTRGSRRRMMPSLTAQQQIVVVSPGDA